MSIRRQPSRDRDASGPSGFFRAQAQAFAETLGERRHRNDLLAGLMNRAYSSYEVNARLQCQGSTPPACYKGCSTCCTLRVTATAPEVLAIAETVRASEGVLRRQGVNLARRVSHCDAVTRGLSEAERVRLKRQCPFLVNGCCVIYPVRPLACRSHLSFDKRACQEAAGGHIVSIPYSEPHMTVRALVQHALQSALRDAGLAWNCYELNHAVSLALARRSAAQAWQSGEDVFADARIAEADWRELAGYYDAIKAQEP